jgi:hypothetical protein
MAKRQYGHTVEPEEVAPETPAEPTEENTNPDLHVPCQADFEAAGYGASFPQVAATPPPAVKEKVPGYRIECPKVDGFWAAKRHFVPGPVVEIKASDLSAADIAELERTDERYLVVKKTDIEV